jgi:hypothetical protein
MVIDLSCEHIERRAVTCRADAASVDCGLGSPNHGNPLVASGSADRLFWEDQLTPSTPSQEALAAGSMRQVPPNMLMREEIAGRTVHPIRGPRPAEEPTGYTESMRVMVST